ncbi:C40 family peptidase [Arthrobacter sp. ISL-72]|uniref:C40 family peptidase n=1 Tax=Arthrobacter sp. ISL-72 TaxID=2819114 RepID=UPI001BE70EC8|nr:C40 family peptidase [Arthrobacter sp. ISL-72]MBT2596034.1 C40 family peptidase [Arthrobacter sp. ISL-72]
MSRAVTANAGTVGRQAAVIAAASGMILSVGMPANAADTNLGVSASTESGSQSAQLAVTAEPTATVSFERPAVTTEAAPKVEAVRAQSTGTDASETTTEADSEGTADKLADAASSAAASGLAAIAYTGIGSPYVWGGTTPSGWDCSGFTQWVYAQAGISIPRVNAWTAMKPTATPAPGDLVMQNGGAHVGIYVGNGMMISALNPSQGTILHAVSATGTSAYYTLR